MLTDDHVLWIWLNSSVCIAQIFNQVISFPDGKEIFRDRLQLDYKTGSLTITNITTTQNGLYELLIIRAGKLGKVSNKIFNVNVYGEQLFFALSSLDYSPSWNVFIFFIFLFFYK